MTISRGQMPRELYQTGTDPEAEKLAKELNISVLEARRILNNMEDTTFIQEGYGLERDNKAGGGVANLQAARDMLQSQALPGEFLAYINPQEAMMLKAMGGAGEPINQSGIPSFFIKKAIKAVTGTAKKAIGAVKDFAKSDIGQIALAIAAPQLMAAYGPAGFATLGGTGFVGNALRSGITNLALQGITTGKFDLGQAAKAGAIGGAVQTGLQNYQQTGSAFRPGRVTEGGQILESTVTPDATVDFEGVQYSDAAPTSTRFSDFDMRVGAGDEQVFGITPQTTTPTVPTTPTTSGQFNLEQALQGFDESEPIAGAIGMEPIQGKYGQTTGTRFTIPTGDTEMISTIKGGIADIPLSDRAGEFSTSIKDIFKEGATVSQRATSAVDALKQISGAALDRPVSTLTITSLLAAASAPKQPDESDFDYAQRISLVREFEDKYGKLAGVSRPDEITDYETFFSERANVAIGGMPMVPMGQPRQNAGGITELDYRDEGGFVPIGIKEKADDVPAMLSKNEFVFTADAVRNAGDGDVDKGAEKLYKTMKTLENGGTLA
jgi:hypothetical protein